MHGPNVHMRSLVYRLAVNRNNSVISLGENPYINLDRHVWVATDCRIMGQRGQSLLTLGCFRLEDDVPRGRSLAT